MKPFTDEWADELAGLSRDILTLPQDSLMMTASIVYLGVHPTFYQDEVKQIWLTNTSLEISKDFSLTSILSSEDEQNKWARQINTAHKGLVQNLLGIRSVSQVSRKCWPLLIDPYDQIEQYIHLVEGVNLENNQPALVTDGDPATQTPERSEATIAHIDTTVSTAESTNDTEKKIIIVDASHKKLGKYTDENRVRKTSEVEWKLNISHQVIF